MGRSEPPRYRQIADDLRTRMESGEYPPDSLLPSKSEMMRHYGVALATVNAAIAVLRDEGRLETQQGKGTFARKPSLAQAEPDGDYAHLAAEVAGLRTELAETLGRIEGNLVELYGKTGNDYPWEDLPAAGKGRSNEQRT
jgi:DNA-binding GntR family transcriptional regulator